MRGSDVNWSFPYVRSISGLFIFLTKVDFSDCSDFSSFFVPSELSDYSDFLVPFEFFDFLDVFELVGKSTGRPGLECKINSWSMVCLWGSDSIPTQSLTSSLGSSSKRAVLEAALEVGSSEDNK